MALGFGKQLVAQRLHAAAGHHGAATQDAGPPTVAFHPLVQSKAGAAIGPVPALGFLAGSALLGALSPVVPLADVLGVQFNNQSEGFFGQRQHLFDSLVGAHLHLFDSLVGAHLFVQLAALLVGTPALATGFPIQGGGRQFHAGQSFNHSA